MVPIMGAVPSRRSAADKRVVGISKLARVVQAYATRFRSRRSDGKIANAINAGCAQGRSSDLKRNINA